MLSAVTAKDPVCSSHEHGGPQGGGANFLFYRAGAETLHPRSKKWRPRHWREGAEVALGSSEQQWLSILTWSLCCREEWEQKTGTLVLYLMVRESCTVQKDILLLVFLDGFFSFKIKKNVQLIEIIFYKRNVGKLGGRWKEKIAILCSIQISLQFQSKLVSVEEIKRDGQKVRRTELPCALHTNFLLVSKLILKNGI